MIRPIHTTTTIVCIKGLQVGGSGAWSDGGRADHPRHGRMGADVLYVRGPFKFKSEVMTAKDLTLTVWDVTRISVTRSLRRSKVFSASTASILTGGVKPTRPTSLSAITLWA